MKYVSISDIFKDVVADVQTAVLTDLQAFDPLITGVHFEHGHYLEIAKIIQQLSLGTTSKFNKWPLVGLFRDFKEKNSLGVYSDISATLIIAKGSTPNWTSDQREANSFIPVLYPILNALFEAMDNDSRFNFQSIEELEFTKTDHYYWGSQTLLDKTPNIFNEYTDSIELNLQLKINLLNC